MTNIDPHAGKRGGAAKKPAVGAPNAKSKYDEEEDQMDQEPPMQR